MKDNVNTAHVHVDMTPDATPATLTRRGVLGGAALGLAGLAMGVMPVGRVIADAERKDDALAAFVRVSAALTQRQQLNPVLAELIFTAMKRDDAGFPAAVQTFSPDTSVPTAQWSVADRTLAKRILSVWYTGLAGEDQNTRVVSFEGALQFTATQDIFIVRSYCPNRPGFWTTTPAGWSV